MPAIIRRKFAQNRKNVKRFTFAKNAHNFEVLFLLRLLRLVLIVHKLKFDRISQGSAILFLRSQEISLCVLAESKHNSIKQIHKHPTRELTFKLSSNSQELEKQLQVFTRDLPVP